jgi:hypothetical protein
LAGQKEKRDSFTRWGYSIGFMKCLGLAEIVAGTFLFLPSTRYLGMIIIGIILMGAVYTHLKKDAAKEALAPVVVGLHLFIIFIVSW